jgi:hypothetical protein
MVPAVPAKFGTGERNRKADYSQVSTSIPPRLNNRDHFNRIALKEIYEGINERDDLQALAVGFKKGEGIKSLMKNR